MENIGKEVWGDVFLWLSIIAAIAQISAFFRLPSAYRQAAGAMKFIGVICALGVILLAVNNKLNVLQHRGLNLTRANLKGVFLISEDLRGAFLPSANLSEANLVRANLSGADLSGADLTLADLRGAESLPDLSESCYDSIRLPSLPAGVAAPTRICDRYKKKK